MAMWNFMFVLLVIADSIVVGNGQDNSVSLESSNTESVSLTSFYETVTSSLPDMDSYTVSDSSTTVFVSSTESYSLPDLDGSSTTYFTESSTLSDITTTPITTSETLAPSTTYIAPTSTSDFMASSTASVLIDCEPPSITYGNFTGNSTTTPGEYPSTELFDCDDTYRLVGPGIIICLPTGNWEALPVCLRDCGTPNIPHGQFSGETYEGSNGTVECNPERVQSGPSIIQCTNGTWSEFPECSYDCGQAQQPENGNVTVNCTFNNCRAEYTCQEGYTLQGQGLAQCIEARGGWNFSESFCQPIECGRITPPISNANYNDTVSTVDSQVLIACDGNYVLSGSGLMTCQSNGEWTTSPECLYGCGTLEAPNNGQIDTDCTIVDCETSFQCDSGFTLVGQNISTCENNRGWSSDSPLCVQEQGDETSASVQLTFQNPPPTNSNQYQQWVRDLERELTQHYRDQMGNAFRDLAITSISPNGTVAYDVVYNTNDQGQGQMAQAHAALSSSPIRLLNQTEPILSTTIGGETYNLADVTDEEDVSCAIYEKARGACSSETECTVGNNTTYCKPLEGDDNYGAIIGLAIGVLVFLILAPLVICCVIMAYKRRRKLEKEDISPPSSTVSDWPVFTSFLPIITTNTIPLRYNNGGRSVHNLYGSDYPQQWSNPTSSSGDHSDDDSSVSDYEVKVGIARGNQPATTWDNQSTISWDFQYPNDAYNRRNQN